jgi:hypothetical protein
VLGEHGRSKMSREIVLEAIWRVPALRLRALSGRLQQRPRERGTAIPVVPPASAAASAPWNRT